MNEHRDINRNILRQILSSFTITQEESLVKCYWYTIKSSITSCDRIRNSLVELIDSFILIKGFSKHIFTRNKMAKTSRRLFKRKRDQQCCPLSNRYGQDIVANMNTNINIIIFTEILHTTKIDSIFNGMFNALEHVNHTCNQ